MSTSIARIRRVSIGIDAHVYVVTDRNNVAVFAHLSESEAQRWMAQYISDFQDCCSHTSLRAEVEGPDFDITIECVDCGLVGELEVDLDDITWVGSR